ncbi:MAG: serine protease [Acidimicrobiia bacterium]
MTRRTVSFAILALTLLSAACTASSESTTTSSAETPAETSTTAPPAVSTAQQVYEQVGPAIASIDTDIAGGSGILIDATTVLTAAHVVWPYQSARVVFPNGTEIPDAPVIGTDLFGDLALIDVSGVANVPAPVKIGDGEKIPLGRPVYLVGYPGESEAFPQPTITEGILSRTREWVAEEWTFLQSDATVVGGQSGGALVDEDGLVIGITNFSFLEEFGLSGSLTDAAAAIELMRSGSSNGELANRLPPQGRGTDVYRLEFENVWQEHIFVFESPLYSDVSFDASSDADASLTFSTIDGLEIASADETVEGEERIDDLVSYAGPHVLRVENLSGSGEVQLRSSVDLTPWPDPDDGQTLIRESTITGNADYPGDFDWYMVDLGKGQAITIDVDAIAFDPILMIDAPGGLGYVQAIDDDSGGGLFGTNPRIVFTAREAGSFFVIVGDAGATGPGAYRLTVD